MIDLPAWPDHRPQPSGTPKGVVGSWIPGVSIQHSPGHITVFNFARQQLGRAAVPPSPWAQTEKLHPYTMGHG